MSSAQLRSHVQEWSILVPVLLRPSLLRMLKELNTADNFFVLDTKVGNMFLLRAYVFVLL